MTPMPLPAMQALLQRQLPSVYEIFQRHGWSPERLQKLDPLIAHFEIRVPVIGAFSSGKSSLLNRLLGEQLLAADVTAETAIPTELHYGPQRQFTGCLPNGARLELNEIDLRENRLTPLQPAGWVEVRLPNPALAARQQLVLVDLPGWDSGVDAHNRVIDDYAGRSLAYCVMVSVEEGTLRDSLRRALLELAVAQMPIIIILSKADKRPAQDVDAVASHVHKEISALMGHQPLAIVITSARKAELGGLEAALDNLQALAGDIFRQRVVKGFRSELESGVQHLSLLAGQDNQDSARIQADMEALEHEIASFDTRLAQETAVLEEQIGPILGTIRVRVENALAGRIEMLADRALSGHDIGDDILGTARLVISEALRQEFAPAMRRYLDRLADALPSRLDFTLGLDRVELSHTQNGGNGEFRWKTLGTTLAPLLLLIPHPVGKLLAPLVGILGALFDSRADQQKQQIEAARQREQARSRIHTALSDAVRQIDAQLRPVLIEQVQKAQAEVARNINAERDDLRKTLLALDTALRQGEEKAAALRQLAQTDLDRIQAMLLELGSTS